MENKEANDNVLLENEGGSKRLIGIVAIVGGVLFILFLGLLSFNFSSNSSDKEKEENNKNTLDMLNANNSDSNNEARFGEEDTFTEVQSSGKGLLSDLGLENQQNSNDLVDSVKNNQTFEPQLTFNENFGNQSPKEEQQPWWLTKDGFMKPRIIKGSSAGVISPRGGEAAKESNEQQKKQDKLNPAEMEQKTLQALNNMLDQTKNIDYNALMSANAEAQAAAGLSGMDFGSDTSYRQNTDFKGEVYQPTSAFYSPFINHCSYPKTLISLVVCKLKL